MKEIDYPLILDGGLSNVLEDYGCDLNHQLWTARLLKTKPELIVRAHLSYLQAGSRCICTSSYQATVKGFMELGLNDQEATRLMLSSVSLAEKARELFNKDRDPKEKIYIAVSMGPYGAMLADGSEYTGKYGASVNDLTYFHEERLRIFQSCAADFFAFETIPSLPEISVLAQLINHVEKPCWISFSCRDEEHLNDGTKIIEAASLLADVKGVFAIGVNCTAPKYVSDIISLLKKTAPDKKIIVYPNSGEIYDPLTKSWKGLSEPDEFGKMALQWKQKGADIIGGCCRIGPAHIQRISELI